MRYLTLRMGLIACAALTPACAHITKTTEVSEFYQLDFYSASLLWQQHAKLYIKTDAGKLEFLGNTKDPGWAEDFPFGFTGLTAKNIAISADGRSIIYEHIQHGGEEKATGLYRHEVGVGDSLLLKNEEFSIPATRYPKPLPSNVVAISRTARDPVTGELSHLDAKTDQVVMTDGTIIPLLLTGGREVHTAAFEGDTQALSHFSREDESSLESVTYWEMNPLEIAVVEGRTDAARQLLDLGVSYREKGPSLLFVASQYRHHELVDEHLQRGVPNDYFLETGRTPFHATLSSDSISSIYPPRPRHNHDTIKTLDAFLRHGVDVNLRTGGGLTALHLLFRGTLIVSRIGLDLADHLLAKGLDAEAVDHDGNTALHYLASNMHAGGARDEERWRSVGLPLLEALVPRVSNIDRKNDGGLSPLQITLKSIPPQVRTAEYLIAHGADASVGYVPHATRTDKQPGMTIQDKFNSIKKSEWWNYTRR